MESNHFDKVHYPGLDVLRGVAILLVLLFHYFAFPIGWIGVDLFFVLSGFLITKSLLQLKGKTRYFQNFFIRRVLRIFPVYFLTLAVFFATAPFLFSQKGPGSVNDYYTGHQVWFWTFTQNWLFINKGLPPEPYLQHLWSLAVEEQFYLCWPLLVYFTKNTKQLQKFTVIAFLFASLLRLALFFTTENGSLLYYNTLTRADSFAAGGFLATSVWLNKPLPKRLTGLIVFLFAGMLLCSFLFYKGWQYNNAVFATVGYSLSALFFTVLCQRMVYATSQFESLSWVKFLGRISYGLYVYHIPILLVVSFVLKKFTNGFLKRFPSPSFFIAVISLAVTVIVGFLSFSFMEQPVLSLKRRLTHAATKTSVEA